VFVLSFSLFGRSSAFPFSEPALSSDGEEIGDLKIGPRLTAQKLSFARKGNPFAAFQNAIAEEKASKWQMALTDDDVRRNVTNWKSEGAQFRVLKKDLYDHIYDNSKLYSKLGQQVAANRLGFKRQEPIECEDTLAFIKNYQASLIKSNPPVIGGMIGGMEKGEWIHHLKDDERK